MCYVCARTRVYLLSSSIHMKHYRKIALYSLNEATAIVSPPSSELPRPTMAHAFLHLQIENIILVVVISGLCQAVVAAQAVDVPCKGREVGASEGLGLGAYNRLHHPVCVGVHVVEFVVVHIVAHEADLPSKVFESRPTRLQPTRNTRERVTRVRNKPNNKQVNQSGNENKILLQAINKLVLTSLGQPTGLVALSYSVQGLRCT